MFKTAVSLVSVFGVIFGGAYALDRLAKARMKSIEKQEADEVELDDAEPEDMEWHQIDLMEFMEKEQQYCGECENCKCDENNKCCEGCNGCNYEDNEE